MRPQSIKAGNHYVGRNTERCRRVVVIFLHENATESYVKYVKVEGKKDSTPQYMTLKGFAKWAGRCSKNNRGNDTQKPLSKRRNR